MVDYRNFDPSFIGLEKPLEIKYSVFDSSYYLNQGMKAYIEFQINNEKLLIEIYYYILQIIKGYQEITFFVDDKEKFSIIKDLVSRIREEIRMIEVFDPDTDISPIPYLLSDYDWEDSERVVKSLSEDEKIDFCFEIIREHIADKTNNCNDVRTTVVALYFYYLFKTHVLNKPIYIKEFYLKIYPKLGLKSEFYFKRKYEEINNKSGFEIRTSNEPQRKNIRTKVEMLLKLAPAFKNALIELKQENYNREAEQL